MLLITVRNKFEMNNDEGNDDNELIILAQTLEMNYSQTLAQTQHVFPQADVDGDETALELRASEEQNTKPKRKKPDVMERILGLNPNLPFE